jgi:F-type H+-transporting ATPase subunit delta
VQPVKSIQGALFGYSASVMLERTLRESAGKATDPAVEYAIRFICLLVEKNCFKHVDTFLEAVEQALEKRKGILSITVESTAALVGGLREELVKAIKKETGAADVKMNTVVNPELLGGYVLRIGGFYVDASLKGQLDALAADLAGR